MIGRRWVLLALVLSFGTIVPLAQGAHASHELHPEPRVWVAWSAAEGAPNRTALEEVHFDLAAGGRSTWGVWVRNDLPMNITNVTLIVVPQAGVANSNLSETYVGQNRGEVFAYWPSLRGGMRGFAVLDLTLADVPGPFGMVFLVTFEADGIKSFSTTTVEGTLQKQATVGLSWPSFVAAVAVAAVRAAKPSGRTPPSPR